MADISTCRPMRSETASSTIVDLRMARLQKWNVSATGGAGSGTFKPISGQENAPNAFEGAGSVILSPDCRFLFTTNGGDNSVSSFRVEEDGRLTLLD